MKLAVPYDGEIFAFIYFITAFIYFILYYNY